MELKIEEIDKCLERAYRKFRFKGYSNQFLLILKDFADEVSNQITISENLARKRIIKAKMTEGEKTVLALKKNNPLRYL